MKIKKGFVLRQVCGENVVVGEGLDAINFGKLLSLNETAAWLSQQAIEMGDFSVESLTAALLNEYEVDEATATRDVASFTAKLNEQKLAEE